MLCDRLYLSCYTQPEGPWQQRWFLQDFLSPIPVRQSPTKPCGTLMGLPFSSIPNPPKDTYRKGKVYTSQWKKEKMHSQGGPARPPPLTHPSSHLPLLGGRQVDQESQDRWGFPVVLEESPDGMSSPMFPPTCICSSTMLQSTFAITDA